MNGSCIPEYSKKGEPHMDGQKTDNPGAGSTGGDARNEKEAPEKKPKKRFSLCALILVCVSSLLLSALITLLLCNRFMYLDTKQKYESKLAALSEELSPYEDPNRFSDPADKFGYIYGLFSEKTVKEFDREALETDLLHKFAELSNDKFARYYSAEEYAKMKSASGSSVGVGITVSKTGDGRLLVTYVEKDGPADKNKIVKGDEITAVDGKSVAEIGSDAALSAIKGKENTTVSLTILRGETTVGVVLKRSRVSYATVHFELDNQTGYLHILSFGSETPKELENAAKELIAAGAKRLVFDLRDTSSGTYSSLQQSLDLFLPDKDEKGESFTLFTINYASGQDRYISDDQKEYDLPAAVLINENTAKEGEIFAQTLRDRKNAKIYGQKSAGDASVQSQYTLKDGSVFVFTSGECLPASGTKIDGVGITPDGIVDTTGVNFYLLPLSEDSVYAAASAGFEN